MPETYPSPTTTYVPGTHKTTYDKDRRKVIIHRVELFSALTHPKFGEFDADRLAGIVKNTNAEMAAGQFPRIVVSHSENAEVVGRICGPVTVETNPDRGLPTIYGDVEIEAEFFDAKMLKNKYPGRSAEINTDRDVLDAVALLGREPPAAKLRDVLYASGETTKFTVESGESVKFDCMGGGMDEILNMIEAMEPEKRAACLRAIADKFAPKTEDQVAEESAVAEQGEEATGDSGAPAEEPNGAVAEDEGESDPDGDTPGDDDDDKEAKMSDTEKATLKASMTELEQKVMKLSADNMNLRYSGVLNGLKAEGYATIKVEDELARLAQFSDDTQRDAYINNVIKANYRKEVTAAGVIAGGSLPFNALRTDDKTAKYSEEDSKKVRAYADKHPGAKWEDCLKACGVTSIA